MDQFCIQHIVEQSPLQILEQKYGDLHYKEANFQSSLKNKVKKLTPKNCSCRLCKAYSAEFGFIYIFC